MTAALDPRLVPLFQPWAFGRTTLRNRIVMAPMTRNRSPGGVPPEAVADYYARRAEGGAGLVITEGTCIDHPAANGYRDVPAFHGAQALAGWERVVRQVHPILLRCRAPAVARPPSCWARRYRSRSWPPSLPT